MSVIRGLAFAAVALAAAVAMGQSARREPHIGYLYPAGVQRGTTARIVVAGQYLRGSAEVYVSDKGVRAKVVRYMKPIFNIQKEQRYLLMKTMAETRLKRLKEARVPARMLDKARAQSDKMAAQAKKQKIKLDGIKLPNHYLLADLEKKSLRELMHIRHVIFFPRQKKQVNRQLGESVLIEVTIDANAAPGDRELRIKTSTGLTNPVVFQVGQLREVREEEPNDRKGGPNMSRLSSLGKDPRVKKLLEPRTIELPALLNGQIFPGDVDRFLFHATEGQKLVIAASARRLVPYLADAVPGWFQATLELYDSDGNEVAFADDYRSDPDPVLFYKIPKDGRYELAIRDAIYRGREDFVYRIAISEQPFITRAFPLGGRQGTRTQASIDGWNLGARQLTLDTTPGDQWIRHVRGRSGKLVSNSVPYAIDTLPECRESEPNDTASDAQRVEMPIIVNGRIARPGDVDVFRIEGSAGDRIVAEVSARRLNSPMDSLLRLIDASGNVLKWNDDHVLKEKHLHLDRLGLATHHADSYLMAELPKKGTYYVQLSDAQNHGSDAHAYRLRISKPRPDFALRVTPSSLQMQPGAAVPICVYAIRKDGFDGAIEIKVKAPFGATLTGGRIPAASNRVRMTLTAPKKAPTHPVALKLEGTARVNGRTISRAAGAADNVMQAFLYRHLMPARQVMVAVTRQKWSVPAIEILGKLPVRIPAGGSTQVRIKTWTGRTTQKPILALNDPPKGLALGNVTVVPGGVAFRLKAEKGVIKSGLADNLIVEAFREYTPKSKSGKVGKKRRSSMGFLPALPIEIVRN